MSALKVGDTLPNGATVLQVSPATVANRSTVLALFHGEFVTWEADTTGIAAYTYWGNYHDQDLTAALVDFERRARGDGEQFTLWVEVLNERVTGTR